MKKPFILEFVERPVRLMDDLDGIEYCKNQNLNICKESKLPAINEVAMETETVTRTGGEVSDPDANVYQGRLIRLMETTTHSFVANESPDSDNDRSREYLKHICQDNDCTSK